MVLSYCIMVRTDIKKKEIRNIQLELIVQGSFCSMPMILIKYWVVWINHSLCLRLLLRRVVNIKTEQYL